MEAESARSPQAQYKDQFQIQHRQIEAANIYQEQAALQGISQHSIVLIVTMIILIILDLVVFYLCFSRIVFILIILQIFTTISGFVCYNWSNKTFEFIQSKSRLSNTSITQYPLDTLMKGLYFTIFSLFAHCIAGVQCVLFYQDTRMSVSANLNEALILLVGVLECFSVVVILGICKNANKLGQIEENVKYLTECISVNLLTCSLITTYSAIYIWYYWETLDFEQLFPQFFVEFSLVFSAAVCVPLSLLYFYSSSNEYWLCLKSLQLLSYILLIVCVIIGVFATYLSIDSITQVQYNCNNFVSPIHQNEVLKIGCEKYGQIQHNLYDLECEKQLISFVWESNLPEYACLNRECCRVMATYITKYMRLLASGMISLGIVFGIMLLSNHSLRQKILSKGQDQFSIIDGKIMLLMLLGIGLTAAIGAAYKVAPPQLNPLKSTMYYVKDAGLVDERYLAKGWCATNFSSNFELENKKEYLLKLIGNMEQIVVNFSGFEVVDEQSESVLILIKGGQVNDLVKTIKYCPKCSMDTYDDFQVFEIQIYEALHKRLLQAEQGQFVVSGSFQISQQTNSQQEINGQIVSESDSRIMQVNNQCKTQFQAEMQQDGQFKFKQPLTIINNPYVVEAQIQSQGQIPLKTWIQIGGLPIQDIFLPSYTLIKQTESLITIQGKVIDPIQNKLLKGAEILIRRGFNNLFEEPIIKIYSDEQGKFQIDQLPEGYYTVQAKLLNYYSDHYNISSQRENLILYLTQILQNQNRVRMLITWQNSEGLDAHLHFKFNSTASCNLNFAYRQCGSSMLHGVYQSGLSGSQIIDFIKIGPYQYLLYVEQIQLIKNQEYDIENSLASVKVFTSEHEQALTNFEIHKSYRWIERDDEKNQLWVVLCFDGLKGIQSFQAIDQSYDENSKSALDNSCQGFFGAQSYDQETVNKRPLENEIPENIVPYTF